MTRRRSMTSPRPWRSPTSRPTNSSACPEYAQIEPVANAAREVRRLRAGSADRPCPRSHRRAELGNGLSTRLKTSAIVARGRARSRSLLPRAMPDDRAAMLEVVQAPAAMRWLCSLAPAAHVPALCRRSRLAVELISTAPDMGGTAISGPGVSPDPPESGVHRVQRVLVIERRANPHLCGDCRLGFPRRRCRRPYRRKEPRIDVYRRQPRGQSIITTDSAVRITHLPTGLSSSSRTRNAT